MILWSTKVKISTLRICFNNTLNRFQDPSPHLFSCLSSCHHPSQYYFEVHLQQVFLMYHSSTFDHTLSGRWPAAFKVFSSTPYRRTKNTLLILCDMENVFWKYLKLGKLQIINLNCGKKCVYLKLFWFVLSCIRTKYVQLGSISPYSEGMTENTDQNNSKYVHCLCSVNPLDVNIN